MQCMQQWLKVKDKAMETSWGAKWSINQWEVEQGALQEQQYPPAHPQRGQGNENRPSRYPGHDWIK